MSNSKVQSSNEIQNPNDKFLTSKNCFSIWTFDIPLAFACLRLPAGRQGRQEL
jgi:hypothetical protein